MVLRAVHGRPDVLWIAAYDDATYHAQSYLVLHPKGNLLVDVPAYQVDVIRAIQRRGGVRYIFITHKDDIGAAASFHEFFQARIIIHKSEARYVQGVEVEVPFEGDFMLNSDIAIVHLPGHTPGSSALLDLRPPGVLFIGDALNIHPQGQLFVPPHPWDFDPVLKRVVLRKLLQYDFELILPAHPPEPGRYVSERGRELLEQLLRRIL